MARLCVRTRASGLCYGRGWHVGARPCTVGERPLAGAVAFHRIWIDYNPRGTARARRKRVCFASSRERERVIGQWRDRVCAHAQAGCLLEAALGTFEHGFSPKKRALSLVQCTFKGHEPATTSAARRARAASAGSVPPPGGESQRSGAIACAHTRKPTAHWRPRLACPSTALYRRKEASRWCCSALPKGIGRLQPARRGARAPQARALRLLPRER